MDTRTTANRRSVKYARLVGLVLFGALGPASVAHGLLPDDCKDGHGVSLRIPEYEVSPNWESHPAGAYATGAAFADIDGDGFDDLVVSRGNDESPQRLAVYYNRGKGSRPFLRHRNRPNWVSRDRDYHGNVAVGDIDRNGCLDVAVGVLLGSEDSTNQNDHRNPASGGVKIYFGERSGGDCELERTPGWRNRDRGFAVFSVALADINGDGLLDLGAASLTEESKKFDPNWNYKPAPTRVYLGRKRWGRDSPEYTASWRTEERLRAGDLEFADVDQDGIMDLAIAAPHPALYRGTRLGDRVTILEKMFAASDPLMPLPELAVGIDVGNFRDPDVNGLAIGISFADVRYGGKGHAFKIFKLVATAGSGSLKEIWTSSSAGANSKLVFANLNNKQDHYLDLIAARWDEHPSGQTGSPVRIYKGSAPASDRELNLNTKPAYCSEVRSRKPYPVGQSLALSDLDNSDESLGLETYSKRLSQRIRVVTLPHELVAKIVKVTHHTADNNEEILTNYAWVPHENWLSFDEDLSGGSLKVKYYPIRLPDYAVGNWNPAGGVVLYLNRRR